MDRFPYDLTGPIGSGATLGLIVLQVDETLEQDMRRLLPGGDVAHHVTRIPSGDELTPDTIATMERTLPAAAALLPPAAKFDVIGYGCTSGTTLIGADRVADLVRQGAATARVTDPLSAALAALEALDARSLAIVSPYVESVSAPVRRAFETRGHDVPATVSFGEEVEARVARIDPASIRAAAVSVGQEADAVFLSCTNLRTLDIIDGLEAELGKPVLSSNQVLAWHMARLAGVEAGITGPGQVFRLPPAAG
ncbi:aspartate/glutamate racemase family protein [Phaeobacter sp. PT47_59]|uniref:maleate cis-trans isomerase family protein n=1 Tax=Phaeobacter sp. PT47_59 TaxID=3029979 RepID=UPI0023808E66|nr:aspartate/glutamate racemase family protein [Phaeobacter sp. PT47_59]MDE4173379.1 aspartate/glutamate racemase family protein [Phaeobacter sp. PT47_59]